MAEFKPKVWMACPLCGKQSPMPDPDAREWTGLTDEDRKLVRDSVGYNQFMTVGEYAELVQKATETLLKVKNT